MKGHIHRRCPKPHNGGCVTGHCQHRWAYTFSAGADPDTGKRRQFTGGGYRTEREAWTACRKAITSAEANTLVTKRQERAARAKSAAEADLDPTVADYVTAHVMRSRLRPNTRDSYLAYVRLYIGPQLANVRLTELTPTHVRRLLEHLARPDPSTGRTRTRGTLARVRATLTVALNAAVLEELIPRNVAARVPIPDTAAEGGGTIEVYSPDQLGRLLEVLVDDRLGALYFLAVFTGLRRGELVGLQWGDVDLDAAQLTIRHSITQRGGELRYGKPKTKKGERPVALDARTVDVLRRYGTRQAAGRLRWGSAWLNDGDLVFTREDGSPVRPDFVTRHFHDLSAQAGLPRIRLHDLRHTHASHALAAGVPIKVVSDRLGHSSTSITENIYTHVVPQVAADAAERIAALVLRPASSADARR